MTRRYSVVFTPSGMRATAEHGASIYDVALDAGVDISSICGGKGLCKRCQIEVEPGRHAKFNIEVQPDSISAPSPTEKKAQHDGELAEGRRLSCRTKVLGDLVVEIPADAREHESSIRKTSTEIHTELNPAVKLYMVKLDVPTFADNPSDGGALSAALQSFGVSAAPNLKTLLKLQHILQENDRTAIAVVRDGSEIIDVWPPNPFNLYGAAIDIGSTSVAIYVFDLTDGRLVYEHAAMNPQIRFGEDLMSRVSYVMLNKGGDKKLTKEIRKQIKTMLDDAQEALGLEPNQLLEVTLVGNPIMHHLFIGADPTPLGQAPFILTTKDWLDIPAPLLDLGLSDVARISLLPMIGGHVGADTTGAYLTQLDVMQDRSVLLVDIGTNAELVLSHNGRLAACSSPTGPAFEGAEISSGVRASHGAIERVRIDKDTKEPVFQIIGCQDWLSDAAPDISKHKITGICGSGIFEVMVELASAGLINQSGLFVPEAAPDRFEADGNSWKYVLVRRSTGTIYIKQTDVRAVQLAKAALSAGVSLLKEFLDCEQFDEVLLAGAFGTHLDSQYVADIGIVADAPAEIIRSIGNAAGMGAALTLLNVNEKAKIIGAVKSIEKMETAVEPKFQDYFVEAMAFPTASPAKENSRNGRRRKRRVT